MSDKVPQGHQIQIDVNKIRPMRIFVGTPMYGGQCAGVYTRSCLDFASAALTYGVAAKFYFMFNESLITRARNYVVDEFLRSDFTHLLFIDSDIGFTWQDVFTLLQVAAEDPSKDVVCAPYPKKTIAWEKIRDAVKQGFADDNPFQLEQFQGDLVFNPSGETTTFNIMEPLEVNESGTGFMLISRGVFERYREAYPELAYKPDHTRSKNFAGDRDIHAYFDCVIDPESRRYLSEDYMFCHNVRKMGGSVWICPWIQLKHVGSYTFTGNMSAIAVIGQSLTASAESNEKFHQKAPRSAKKIRRGPARR